MVGPPQHIILFFFMLGVNSSTPDFLKTTENKGIAGSKMHGFWHFGLHPYRYNVCTSPNLWNISNTTSSVLESSRVVWRTMCYVMYTPYQALKRSHCLFGLIPKKSIKMKSSDSVSIGAASRSRYDKYTFLRVWWLSKAMENATGRIYVPKPLKSVASALTILFELFLENRPKKNFAPRV